MTLDDTFATQNETSVLGVEVRALRAQVCRLISGQAIESDHLCQHHDADLAARAEVDRLRTKVDALTAELAAVRTAPTIEAAIDRLKLSEATALKARSGEWDLGEIAAANAESHAAELALIAAILVAQEAARRDPSHP